ncbi:MAG: TolC family protein [Micavibrio sp.]|nr:TolC family protein [Micavibrio sp.]
MSALMLVPFSVKAESMRETVAAALNHHPQVHSTKLSADSAEQDILEQRSGYFPELSVSATGGRVYGDNATSRGLSVTRGAGYSYLWEGSVTGRQKIWDNFETKKRIDAARAQEQAAMLGVADVREQLAFRTVQAYIDTIRARNGLSMVRDYREQVEDYLQRIKELVDEGAGDEAELHQATEVLLFLKNFEADYEGQVKVAESDLIEMTGTTQLGEMFVESAPIDRIPEMVEAAIAQAKDAHPAVLAARKEIDSASYEIEAERSAYYPDVDGEVSYFKSDKADLIGGEATDARAIVRVSWDFETGGATRARIKRSKIEQQAAQSRVAELHRSIERGIRFAFAENETAAKQMENQKQRQDLNSKLFETYKTQFEGAMVPLIQVMQADNQLFNARLETMNAQHRYVLSQYGILASLGRLQEALGIGGHVANVGLSSDANAAKVEQQELTQKTAAHDPESH